MALSALVKAAIAVVGFFALGGLGRKANASGGTVAPTQWSTTPPLDAFLVLRSDPLLVPAAPDSSATTYVPGAIAWITPGSSPTWRVVEVATPGAATGSLIDARPEPDVATAVLELLQRFAAATQELGVEGFYQAERGPVTFVVEQRESSTDGWRWYTSDDEVLAGTEPTRGPAIVAAVNAAQRGPMQGVAPPIPPVSPPLPPPPPTGTMTREVRDGELVVTMTQNSPGGGWRWSVAGLDGDGCFVWKGTRYCPPGALTQQPAPFGEARLAAWLALRGVADVGFIVPAPTTRNGVQLRPDGSLIVTDALQWGVYAGPLLQAEYVRGERDPMGLILAPLLRLFPGVNVFRMTGYSAASVQAVVQALNQQNATPANAGDLLARGVFQLPLDPLAYTFRGHVIRLRQGPVAGGVAVNGQPNLVWQWSIDGGAWRGAFPQRVQAQAAAQGSV